MNPQPVRSSHLALAVLFGLALPGAANAQAPVRVQTFHREFINWNDAHAKTFAFPAASIAFRGVILTIKLECPGGGCDPWDRSATVTIKGKDDAGRVDTFEIARFITPYGIGCSWTADVTDYRPLLAGNAELGVHIDTFIGGQKGWLVSLDFEFTPGTPARRTLGIRNLWRGSPEYGNPDKPITSFFAERKESLRVSSTGAKLRFFVTGHGQGNTDNAAEFARKIHGVFVNGTDHKHTLWRDDCDKNPCSPQGGTWQFARAGWCPGNTVPPWDVDITSAAIPGPATIRYHVEPFVNRCRPIAGCAVSDCPFGNCDYDGGSHTVPIYWVESQLISYTTEQTFIRGDINGDGTVDIGDAVGTLIRLFAGKAFDCQEAADVNDDAAVDITDVVGLLNYLFIRDAAPRPPFGKCGVDPTSDDLTCTRMPSCP